MTENEARIATERRVVRTLIRTLKGEGWSVIAVYDGEDTVRWDNDGPTEAQVMDTVFSVDTSVLWFRGAGNTQKVLIVLGNGVDVIADWSDRGDDVFDAVMDHVLDKVQGWE